MPIGLEQLKIYQIAEELELTVHKLVRGFPQDERFRSVDQLLRSSSSVTNNIAEAYHRQSPRDRVRIFRDICRGEAAETRSNILRCAKKGFCAQESAQCIADRYEELLKGISGFVRYLERKADESSPPHS